jgi:hypothetical protein
MAGRPRAIESPEQLYEIFIEYIEECIAKSRFANTAGFRRYADIPKSTYYDYEKREEYSDTIKKMDDILEDETLNAKMAPAEKIFYLKNKFGYTDKQEIESKNDNTVRIVLGGELEEWAK